MSLTILDCDQNSPEWLQARLGLPTASMFGTVMAKGRDGGASLTRRTYMLKLAGEILTGEPAENYTNVHMERGHAMEDEARRLYDFIASEQIQRVGFVTDGKVGCSPDSLLGDKGVLEIKTKLPHLLLEVMLKDDFPAEHKAQCQGALWVTGRDFVDIAVYWPKLPLFTKRAYRDEVYIATIAKAVEAFRAELHDVVEHARRYGAGGSDLGNLLAAG